MHIPVLLKEVIEFLNPEPNDNFVDCTLGGGGHSLEILEKIKPNGKILAIDLDHGALEVFENTISGFGDKERVTLVNGNFADLEDIADKNNFKSVKGILLDLGFSSNQLEEGGRGLSFLKDEPLDMRLGAISSSGGGERGEVAAEDIINSYRYEDLARIFREYGEERNAGRIAKTICEYRKKNKIKTTGQLVEVVSKVNYRSRIHPATRVFQALRIAVNQELDNLEKVLPQAVKILEPKGRLAVISFHSLEDRIVKHFFRNKKQEGALNILTKKPFRPSEQEAMANPRSRSAKLRVAEKI